MADLPIVPDEFKLVVRDERSRKQFTVISKQLRRDDVDVVINACDAGREGELIFAWTYEKANARKPVERLWLSSMTGAAIKEAFHALHPAQDYARLEQAAARSEADCERRRQRHPGGHHPVALVVRRRGDFGPRTDTQHSRSSPAGRRRSGSSCPSRTGWSTHVEPSDGDSGRRYHGRHHAGSEPRLKTAAEAEAIVAAVQGQPGEIATSTTSARRSARRSCTT